MPVYSICIATLSPLASSYYDGDALRFDNQKLMLELMQHYL